jgi:hypothetical protein
MNFEHQLVTPIAITSFTFFLHLSIFLCITLPMWSTHQCFDFISDHTWRELSQLFSCLAEGLNTICQSELRRKKHCEAYFLCLYDDGAYDSSYSSWFAEYRFVLILRLSHKLSFP